MNMLMLLNVLLIALGPFLVAGALAVVAAVAAPVSRPRLRLPQLRLPTICLEVAW